MKKQKKRENKAAQFIDGVFDGILWGGVAGFFILALLAPNDLFFMGSLILAMVTVVAIFVTKIRDRLDTLEK